MSCCRRNRKCQNYNWNTSNSSCNCNSVNNYNNLNRTCGCNYIKNCNRCSCMNNNYNSRNEQGFPENYMLAHAYTPNQVMGNVFTPEMALQKGTLFPELVSPYYPGKSMEIIEYLENDERNGECGCE